MQWKNLLCAERSGSKPAKKYDGRSPFLSDHDKIIFSQAFRRLARKTQVHPLAVNDHVHNRMTHSLEVSCIGRSLAIRVGKQLQQQSKLPDGVTAYDLGDIVQSTCLAHDIGNPPFGHTGEEAIGKWFQAHENEFLSGLNEREKMDLLHFEGNAQGLRILTASEEKEDSDILSLTYATLSAFIKYPWAANHVVARNKNKYGIFASEQSLFNEISLKTGIVEKQPGVFCRHPLVYMMEAADDICYGLLDLEDGLEMGIVSWDDVCQVFMPVLSMHEQQAFNKHDTSIKVHKRMSHIRGALMETYIHACVEAYLDNEADFLKGDVESDLIALCSGTISESVDNAKRLAREKIFTHPGKVELEIGAYEIIYNILNKVIPAVKSWYEHGEAREKEYDMVIQIIGESNLANCTSYYQTLMAAIDFVSGMTDNYASYLSKQFTGLGRSRHYWH